LSSAARPVKADHKHLEVALSAGGFSFYQSGKKR
jgi:hypothetical protein